MNQGAKYTLVIAAVLFGAAVFPLLAVAASFILVGMALHSILSAEQTTPSATHRQHLTLNRDADRLIKQTQRRLDHDHR